MSHFCNGKYTDKIMKREEFQINDLVRVWGKPYRVEAIGIDGVALASDDERVIIRLEDLEGVKPIPISRDILVREGFRVSSCGQGNQYWVAVRYIGKQGTMIKVFYGGSEDMTYCIYSAAGISIGGSVTYLHDLQHSLRAARLYNIANSIRI